MSEPHLIRTLSLRLPMLTGTDVEAVRRGGIRYLEDDQAWEAYLKMGTKAARTFGPGMRTLVRRIEQKSGLLVDGHAGPAVDRILRKHGGYDSTCDKLLLAYQASTVPAYCYPHPLGSTSSICQELHETAGLDGNAAYDFCAQGGTPVLAVVAAEVVKISGSPYLRDSNVGLFGYNLHYRTSSGYRWFSTHYGSLRVREGQRLRVGEIVGMVGHWPHNPGRSHTHLGVTSPHGWSDAVRTIERIAHARKLPIGSL